MIDVEEEFRQRVFHITVYKAYDLGRLEQGAAPRSGGQTTVITGQQ
jgi:hypothetical protein